MPSLRAEHVVADVPPVLCDRFECFWCAVGGGLRWVGGERGIVSFWGPLRFRLYGFACVESSFIRIIIT